MTTSTKHWRYEYRGGKHGEYWSVMFLDSRGGMCVYGDTGEWAPYHTFSCNDIRHFVAYRLKGDDYLKGKLTKDRKNEFNGAKTLIRAKKHIIYYRRDNAITKERARELWNDLPDGEEGYDNKREWEYYMDDLYYDFWGSEWYDYLVYDWDSQVESFCKNSLPGLQALIRKELEEEACKRQTLVV